MSIKKSIIESLEIIAFLLIHLLTGAILFILIAGFAVLIELVTNYILINTDSFTTTLLTFAKHFILIIDVFLLILYVASAAYQTIRLKVSP